MKKIILSITLIGYVLSISAMMPQQMPAGGFDPQQMQMMEQQLMQEIDQYVNSLSPEEQEEFKRAVEEETKKIESMSPDELDKYIQETFAGAGAEMPMEPEAPKAETAKKEPAKEVKVEDTKQQKDVINLIDSLSKLIESYTRKLNASPETSAKLPRWARQGRIVGWKPDATFNSYKKDLDAFDQQLKKIVKRDDKTKKYIFLPDVATNEALINNMAQLKNTLAHWEPQIVLRALDFETLNPASKKALIQATNTLLEGLYNLAIPKALDDIIVKYDPEAKKLRDEAEKREKQALEESKRGPRQTPTSSVGSEPMGRGGYSDYNPYGDYYGGGYGGYDPYSGGYGSYGDYSPYGSYSDRMAQAPQPYGTSSGYSGSGRSAGGSTGRGRGRDALGAANAKDDALPDARLKDSNKKTKDTSAKPIELSAQAKRRINSFGSNIETALTKLELAQLLSTPFDTIKSVGAIDNEEIIQVVNAMTQAAHPAIEALEAALTSIKLLAADATITQRKAYGNELRDVLQDNQSKLAELLKQINKIQKEEDQLSSRAKYVFLGGKDSEDVPLSEEVKKKFAKPFNLYKVGKLLQNIKNAINNLVAGRPLPKKKAKSANTITTREQKSQPTISGAASNSSLQ